MDARREAQQIEHEDRLKAHEDLRVREPHARPCAPHKDGPAMSDQPVETPDVTPAEEPWRCVECGLYNYPEDGGFIRTKHGPVCGSCAQPDRRAA